MNKDEEISDSSFDINTFEKTLNGIIDPIELWLIAGDCRDQDVSSSTTALKMVKDSCDMGYIQKPTGVQLASAASCSPQLMSRLWNNGGYKKKEIKESAIFTPQQEQKILENILKIIDETGIVTLQEINEEAEKLAGRFIGYSFSIRFLQRHKDSIGIIATTAREERRVKLKEEDVLIYLQLIIEELKGIPAELIIQGDEV
ncbi:MAG: hypothetical protein EZS28_012005, partial [Streblomastix strix]